MEFIKTHIEDLYVIELSLHVDERGWFSRTFCQKEFNSIGFNQPFTQHNHSYNALKGTLRGMHFQNPPYTESKLIRCIAGEVFDVAVDLRKGSSTFLNWYGVKLSAKNKKMILIPEGFAHGFLTLEDHTELLYFHTGYYHPKSDSGIHHNDKSINIKWPEAIENMSSKDQQFKLLDHNFKGI